MMKKLFIMLAVLLALALPKDGQAVETEGMYVGGLAGFNWLTNSKDSHEDFKAGWIGGLNLGYRMCSGIRAEAEVAYRRNIHKHANRPVQNWSFMANGYYELGNFGCFCITPYVGAGIGYDRISHRRCNKTSSQENKETNKNSGFAWQLMLGGFYDIDECMEVGVEYRLHNCTAKRVKNFYNNALDFRINWFF